MAYEDAQRDYKDAAGKREASAALPRAWRTLLAEPEELLLELVADKAEVLCGFRPVAADVLAFLKRLREGSDATSQPGRTIATRPAAPMPMPPPLVPPVAPPTMGPRSAPGSSRGVMYRLFGEEHIAANGNDALVRTLEALCSRDPGKIPALAKAVEGRSRNHIAQSASEIYPARPDLARAAEFHPGWFVGLNIANREKMGIIRTACDVYGLTMPGDIEVSLPNAG
jgi:hypothetical protein